MRHYLNKPKDGERKKQYFKIATPEPRAGSVHPGNQPHHLMPSCTQCLTVSGCQPLCPQGLPSAHLVLAVVLLRVPQHPVAEAEHVLVGGVLLVRQFLQPHQWSFTPLVTEWSLQDAKDLRGVESERDSLPSRLHPLIPGALTLINSIPELPSPEARSCAQLDSSL